jgi:hypothetical protein
MSLTIVGYYLMVYGRGGFWDQSIAYFADYEAALKTKRQLEARNCQPMYIKPDYQAEHPSPFTK